LDGPVAAGLVHWGLGVLVGLAAVVLARPVLGREAAWLVGGVVLLVPGVNNQMTAPLNDLALVLSTTVALAAWWRGVVAEAGRRWYLLAGLAAGGALATKYTALVFAVAMGIGLVGSWLRRPRRRRELAGGAAVVAVVAISVGGLWYVRAAWYRGNPVYPFLGEALAGGPADLADPHQTLPRSKSPLGRTPLGPLVAVWKVTMEPEGLGGRGHQPGVLFLAFLPGLAVVRRLRGLGGLLGVGLAYGVVWYLLRQNVRFLLPLVPILAVGVVWVWLEARRFDRIPRAVITVLIVVLAGAYAAVPLARCGGQAAVALGLERRTDYLRRHEPTWQAADVSNRCFGAEGHLLSQDYRAYYFQCRVTREAVYRRRTGYQRGITRPGQLAGLLHRAGFTHLLLAENLSRRGIQYDRTLSRLVEAEWAAGQTDSLLPLAEYRFTDADGALRRYRLVLVR